MEIELYHTPQTRSLRPRWLLEELDIPYTLHPIDLFGGESNPTHPLGSVPSVRIDGEIMIESGAICHWLADQFPEKGLAPAHNDTLRRAYEQWMFFNSGTLEPNGISILVHTQILPEQDRVKEIVGFSEKNHQRVLRMLAAELDHEGFLLGAQFSCADILIGSTLTWLPEMLEPFPALLAYTQRVTARDAYKRARQPIDTD